MVPQSADRLQSANLVNEQLVVSYLKDARSDVRIFGLDGKLVRTVELPGIGTAGGFGGQRRDTETFYAFTGFIAPTSVYRYDLRTGASSLFRQPKAPG